MARMERNIRADSSYHSSRARRTACEYFTSRTSETPGYLTRKSRNAPWVMRSGCSDSDGGGSSCCRKSLPSWKGKKTLPGNSASQWARTPHGVPHGCRARTNKRCSNCGEEAVSASGSRSWRLARPARSAAVEAGNLGASEHPTISQDGWADHDRWQRVMKWELIRSLGLQPLVRLDFAPESLILAGERGIRGFHGGVCLPGKWIRRKRDRSSI